MVGPLSGVKSLNADSDITKMRPLHALFCTKESKNDNSEISILREGEIKTSYLCH